MDKIYHLVPLVPVGTNCSEHFLGGPTPHLLPFVTICYICYHLLAFFGEYVFECILKHLNPFLVISTHCIHFLSYFRARKRWFFSFFKFGLFRPFLARFWHLFTFLWIVLIFSHFFTLFSNFWNFTIVCNFRPFFSIFLQFVCIFSPFWGIYIWIHFKASKPIFSRFSHCINF